MRTSPPKSCAPPDGGWGWIVVFGVALINTFNQSLVSVFGLLFKEHLESLGQTTVGAALVMNLNSLALNFSGLLIGPLLKRYSSRRVAAAGSILAGTGMILSSFTTQLWQVCFSYGLLVGIFVICNCVRVEFYLIISLGVGLGLIGPSTFIAVRSYFTLRRGQAVGLAMAGTGLGQMIMPQVVTLLLEFYGFRGTMLIMGGLALNGVVGASLFRPVHQLLKLEKNRSDEITTETTIIEAVKPKTWTSRISRAMDLKLLQDLIFINIIIGISLIYTTTVNFSMILPYFLQVTAGLSNTDVALCMSVLAGTDLASRLTLPLLTDKFKISCRTLFLMGSFLLIIIRTILAETLHRTNLIWMSALYGYVRSLIIVNQNLTISEYVSQDRLAGALGLSMITKGIFVITTGQMLGWIRDHYQSYPMCLHAQSVLSAILIITWSMETVIKRCKTYNAVAPKVDSQSEHV